MNWFVIRVKSRHEKAVAYNLQARDFTSFTPLYTTRHQWTDRQKTLQLPLFPGYVFCQFGAASLHSVMQTPGVTDIVKFGDTLAPVDDGEIQALQKLVQSGCRAEPSPYIEIGQSAEIVTGPLAGLSGTVVQLKSGLRLVLSVTLLRRSVQVEIDRNSLACRELPMSRRGL